MSNTAGSTDTTSLNVESLTVSLGERSYPIFVGDVGFSDPAKLAEGLEPYLKGNQVAIITNETIAPLYLQQVQSALGNRQVDVFQMPDGESYKSCLVSFGKQYPPVIRRCRAAWYRPRAAPAPIGARE